MNMKKDIVLIATPLRFHCPHDEDALFEWLNKIPCITNVKGIGRELHISIDSPKQSHENVRDLFGLFKRYKFKNIDQLKVFINEETKYLFE